MVFKDLKTGLILKTENETVIAQYKKYSERYKEVKAKPAEAKEKKTE